MANSFTQSIEDRLKGMGLLDQYKAIQKKTSKSKVVDSIASAGTGATKPATVSKAAPHPPLASAVNKASGGAKPAQNIGWTEPSSGEYYPSEDWYKKNILNKDKLQPSKTYNFFDTYGKQQSYNSRDPQAAQDWATSQGYTSSAPSAESFEYHDPSSGEKKTHFGLPGFAKDWAQQYGYVEGAGAGSAAGAGAGIGVDTSKDDLLNRLVDALTKSKPADSFEEQYKTLLGEQGISGEGGLLEQVGSFDDELNKAASLLDDLDLRIRGGEAKEAGRLAPMELITGRQQEIRTQAGIERGDILNTMGQLGRGRESAEKQLSSARGEVGTLLGLREKDADAPLADLKDELGVRGSIESLFKEDQPRTAITEAGGQRLLVNLDTGDTIANLGSAGVTGGKMTDQDRVDSIKELMSATADESGMVESGSYVGAAQMWIGMGGTFADFKVAFPPEVYLNDKEQGNLPSSLRPSGVEPTGEFGDFEVQVKGVIQQMKDSDMSRGDAKDYILSQYEQEYKDGLPKILKDAIEDMLVEVYGRTFWQKAVPGGR